MVVERELEADQPFQERAVEGVGVVGALATEEPVELKFRLCWESLGDRDSSLPESARGNRYQQRLAADRSARQVVHTLRDQLVAGEVLEVMREHGRSVSPEPPGRGAGSE